MSGRFIFRFVVVFTLVGCSAAVEEVDFDELPRSSDRSDFAADGADVPPPEDRPAECVQDVLPAGSPIAIVVIHNSSDRIGVAQPVLETFTLGGSGLPRRDGAVLALPARTSAVAVLPSGRVAIALGESGAISAVKIGALASNGERAAHEIISQVFTTDVPNATPYGRGASVLIAPDGRSATVTGGNAIRRLGIACDGTLSLDASTELFQAGAGALDPTDPTSLLLLGGQSLIPGEENPHDIRLFDVNTSLTAPTQRAEFDIYQTMVNADSVAISPDGTLAMTANTLPFGDGGVVVTMAFDRTAADGPTLREISRLTLPDATETLISSDGQTALVSRGAYGRVNVFARDERRGFVNRTEVTGLGYVRFLRALRTGPRAGLVFVSSTSAASPGVTSLVVFRFGAPGTLTRVGAVALGRGFHATIDGLALPSAL